MLGISVSNYEVYVNGSTTPTALVTSNQWTMTAANGLADSTTAYFQVDYVTTDGRTFARSPHPGQRHDLVGFELGWHTLQVDGRLLGRLYRWQISRATGRWRRRRSGRALTVYGAFVSGGNPPVPPPGCRQQFVKTPQGMFLSWNTQPGATYQVQISTDLKTWSNTGSPRFAAGRSDSINIGNGNPAGYYQVILMR